MNRHVRRLVAGVAALAGTAVLAGPALASGNVVVSQVYGGGGNSGATLKNDYIELYNRSSASVDLSSWSVQYASSAGSSWSRTNLSGSIAPGATYLIQESAGTGGTVDLPSPNATGTIAMSATAGKVALVSTQTAIASELSNGRVDRRLRRLRLGQLLRGQQSCAGADQHHRRPPQERRPAGHRFERKRLHDGRTDLRLGRWWRWHPADRVEDRPDPEQHPVLAGRRPAGLDDGDRDCVADLRWHAGLLHPGPEPGCRPQHVGGNLRLHRQHDPDRLDRGLRARRCEGERVHRRKRAR